MLPVLLGISSSLCFFLNFRVVTAAVFCYWPRLSRYFISFHFTVLIYSILFPCHLSKIRQFLIQCNGLKQHKVIIYLFLLIAYGILNNLNNCRINNSTSPQCTVAATRGVLPTTGNVFTHHQVYYDCQLRCWFWGIRGNAANSQL